MPLDPLTGSAIAQSTVGMAQSAGNLIGTILTNRANQKEAQKQRDWNLQIWNKQNAYNAPQAQKQRLEEAGLNTNLMYGSAPQNTGGQIATYQKPQLDWRTAMPNIIGIMSGIEDIKQKRVKTDQEIQKNIGLKYQNIKNMFDTGSRVQYFGKGKYGRTFSDSIKLSPYGRKSEAQISQILENTALAKQQKEQRGIGIYNAPWNVRSILNNFPGTTKYLGTLDYMQNVGASWLSKFLPKFSYNKRSVTLK